MIIITDSKSFTEKFFEKRFLWEDNHCFPKNLSKITKSLFDSDDLFSSEIEGYKKWKYLFITELAEDSQFDVINKVSKKENFEFNFLCVADSGKKFHGFRNRSWESISGNLHLTAYFSPKCEIENFAPGLMALSAVSIVQTLDEIIALKLKSSIKWVNDILVNGSKISGIITSGQIKGFSVESALVGIGLNVKKTPEVKRDSFVPQVTSIYEQIDKSETVKIGELFKSLVLKLDSNFQKLLNGYYLDILEIYKNRSIILGKKITVFSDEIDGENKIMYDGIVHDIEKSLGIILKNEKQPILKGRVVL